MASVSSLGIGSGLDLGSILSQLVEAERAPTAQRLDFQEAKTQATISAFGSLKSSLSEFQAALQGLAKLEEFQTRSATSSNRDIFTATADNTAAVGSANVNVLNLAEAHKLVTADFASPDAVVGTGSLQITAGGSSFTVNVTEGKLSDIKDAINNSSANTKLSASILTVDDGSGGTVSKLVLTAKDSGTDGAIEVTVSDDDSNNTDANGLSQMYFKEGDANNRLTELVAATDARITVDGFTVSSANNEFKNVITGVTITALQKSADPDNEPPGILTIAVNKSNVQGKVNTFISSFNDLKDTLNQLLDFNTATGKAAILTGDTSARNTESQISRLLYGNLSDATGKFNNLAQLGISTDANGKLSLNQETFDRILAQDFDDIGSFFASDKGLAKKLDGLMTNLLGSTGIIKAREDGLNTALQQIADDREALDRRLAAIEERTRQQFAALDGLISQLNSTGNFLAQQLSNTNAIITGSTKK
jgi:flagellar hook-associated protein 2